MQFFIHTSSLEVVQYLYVFFKSGSCFLAQVGQLLHLPVICLGYYLHLQRQAKDGAACACKARMERPRFRPETQVASARYRRVSVAKDKAVAGGRPV